MNWTSNGSVVTVGTFDGVHLGHRAILGEIANRAERTGRRSVLVTFEPHPLEVVNPQAAPPLLTLPDERREILAQSDLDVVAFLPFTHALSQYSPEDFIQLLIERYSLEELVIGHDHGFGRGRAGNEDVLRRLGEQYGFSVDAIDAVALSDRPLSSTLVRRALAGGDLDTAAGLLGRPYSLTSPVKPGARRGREIGYRTINLHVPHPRKLLPPNGVYAVVAEWRDGRAGGMMHQGPRPTFDESERSLEVHLFDVDADLYGAEVKVSWISRLRDVMTFRDAQALKAQLDKDVAAARHALTGHAVPASH